MTSKHCKMPTLNVFINACRGQMFDYGMFQTLGRCCVKAVPLERSVGLKKKKTADTVHHNNVSISG